jgi:hypothetical protein
MAERREETVSSKLSPIDNETLLDAEKWWRSRFLVKRPPITQTEVVEDSGKILELLKAWPEYFGGTEHNKASAVKNSLKKDDPLYKSLANVLEQGERHAIIKDGLTTPHVHVGAKPLGVVASGRLEAVCLWEIVTGTEMKDGTKNAKYWHEEWTRTLYIPELTSASWNVGWPTKEVGVSGAGKALVEALKKKAKEQNCQGIGLFGLLCNVGFYQNVGFTCKPGMLGSGFPPFFMDARE